ncbi:hypothetical protein Nepgr_014743 [Nepenthes gracilis]|uniref:Uncharacterized protein n=1 Tax=Nepenthes gracilis TaxID=150966 RepID=A0AAD3SLU6_NEPGR|nr:hypothetical protein Nepgr_014743 [Nepenthes gracilis]
MGATATWRPDPPASMHKSNESRINPAPTAKNQQGKPIGRRQQKQRPTQQTAYTNSGEKKSKQCWAGYHDISRKTAAPTKPAFRENTW